MVGSKFGYLLVVVWMAALVLLSTLILERQSSHYYNFWRSSSLEFTKLRIHQIESSRIEDGSSIISFDSIPLSNLSKLENLTNKVVDFDAKPIDIIPSGGDAAHLINLSSKQRETDGSTNNAKEDPGGLQNSKPNAQRRTRLFNETMVKLQNISIALQKSKDDSSKNTGKDPEIKVGDSFADIPVCERKACRYHIQRKILFGIKSPAKRGSSEWRDMIRQSYVRQIKEYPQANYTFYVSRASSDFAEGLRNETEAYRDILVLGHLPESRRIGCTMKTVEFFKAATRPGAPRYDWICHVDDDSYLQVYRMMERLLLNSKVAPNRTVIARKLVGTDTDNSTFDYPGGQLYCLSWDLAAAYAARIHDVMPHLRVENASNWPDEDLLAGLFLFRAGLAKSTTFITLPNPVAYDVGRNKNLNAWYHVPNPRHGIVPHKLKTPQRFRDIVELYEATHLRG